MNKITLIPYKTIELSQEVNYFKYKFKSGSFAIIKNVENTDEYILNFRCIINNAYNSNLNNLLITINKILKLDKNYSIIDENKNIIPSLLPAIIRNKNAAKKSIYGIEDMRIFNYNNKIKIIGSHQTKNNTLNIVSGNYNYLKNSLENVNILNHASNYQQIEKNWVYFEKNDTLQVIYKWYPLQICEINSTNLNVVTEQKMPPFFKTARGSSCGVKYKNQLWFVVHFNTNGHYSHFFTVFDMNMKLIKFSKNFKFKGAKIEFCIGLYIDDNNNFLIPYSIHDTQSFLGIYHISMINKLPWKFV
jgi:hypothetical protein